MFRSFLPKVCAIPAAAVPLAIINVLGHVPPVEGIPQQQNKNVKIFCMFCTVFMPFILATVSFFLKTRFPLKTQRQVEQVSERSE